jgi:hypothetical protein
MNLANSNRHPDADTSLVSVERSDVIDAAAALALMARENRQASKLRQNGGPANASHRLWLRETADVYDDAARRMQAAADASSSL